MHFSCLARIISFFLLCFEIPLVSHALTFNDSVLNQKLSARCLPLLSKLQKNYLLGGLQIKPDSFRIVQKNVVIAPGGQSRFVFKVGRKLLLQRRFFFEIGKPYLVDQQTTGTAQVGRDGEFVEGSFLVPSKDAPIEYYFYGRPTSTSPYSPEGSESPPKNYQASPGDFLKFLNLAYGKFFISIDRSQTGAFLVKLDRALVRRPSLRELTVENYSWKLFDQKTQKWQSVIFDIEGLLMDGLK